MHICVYEWAMVLPNKQRALLALFYLLVYLHLSLGLRVEAEFNQRGVRGAIVFSQLGPSDNTSIAVNLTGLSQHPDTSFLWHVHQYPFPLNGLENPCSASLTGGHYDPLGANLQPNYTAICAVDQRNCEIGDLSGKFGRLNVSDTSVAYTDPFLSLYGEYSIIGRSVVIHLSNGTRLVCANVGYPTDGQTNAQTDILYSPFRNDFAGDVFFRGHTDNVTASVYTDLLRLTGSSNSQGHNWHVHENPLDTNGTDCSVAGPHYNPYSVDTTGMGYNDRCNNTSHRECEVGDLSNKGAPLQVRERVVKQFYTDTFLPLAGDTFFIEKRSIVIHAENHTVPRIACANITRFNPLEAVVNFNESGILGSISFSQLSPYDMTSVKVSLQGLQGMAGGYHVHVYPVRPEGIGSERCAAADGHWNPTGITYEPNNTRQLTSDEYEIGDLSGKFGSFGGLNTVTETYFDPNIPLFGTYSIVGRSVVIHRSVDGSRWTCGNIELVRPVVQVIAFVNTTSYRGQITFTQPADDPYAETTIVIELEVLQEIITPPVTTTPTSSQTATPTTNQLTPSPGQFITTPTASFVSATPTTSVQGATPTLTLNSSLVTSTPTLQVTPSPSILQPINTTTIASPVSSIQTSQLQSVPTPTPSVSVSDVGSGFTMDIIPFGSTTDLFETTTTTSTPTPGGRRKKRTLRGSRNRGDIRGRQRRQTGGDVGFDWSVRRAGPDGGMTDCNSLDIFEANPSNPTLCSPTNPLACSSGDLTSKHGPLLLPRQPGPVRVIAVFTDPALPLSGPQSPFTSSQGGVLLVQPVGGASSGDTVSCAPATVVEETTPTVTTTTDIETTTQEPSPVVGNAVVIGAAVGGVLGGLLLVVIVIIIVLLAVWCTRRRSKYQLSEKTNIELGTVRPLKPIIGVPYYRALHNYSPQNEDDLQLVQGEWVTLLETPLGGDWWRGSVEGRGEGWFPRNYVEYVDVEAERKRQQDENFLMAASAIVAASSSFSATHPSLSKKRNHDTASPTHGGKSAKRSNTFSKKSGQKIEVDKVQRSQTFSRRDIDSTPRAVRKLDRPYLADDDNTEAVVITNIGGGPNINGGSQPDTPLSQRNTEFYSNKMAVEGGSSQESEGSSMTELQTARSPEGVNANLLQTDQYIAKFDFNGSTDIELHFKKGSLISVVEKSDGGWWKGVFEGRVGWFPDTYIRPVPVEERGPAAGVDQPGNMEELMATGDDLEAVEYRAMHPFHSDTEGDLVFPEGETVWVYWAQDNGWWFGAAGSAQGWFPGSFVEPVIDLSEAGSVSAFNSQLTKEDAPLESIFEATPQEVESGGSLASQLAAAVKKRKSSKQEQDSEKDSKSFFKRRWSSKRKSRDKGRASVSTEEQHVASPGEESERLPSTTESPGGLQGQILAALERRHSFGRDRHLTIDEQIASGKKRRTSEAQPHKSRTEMVADFVRRSFKRTKAPADVVPETGEAANTAAESESEGGATKMEVKSDAAEMEREATVVISNESAAAEETPEPRKKTQSPRKHRRDTKSRRPPPAPPTAGTPTLKTTTEEHLPESITSTEPTRPPPSTSETAGNQASPSTAESIETKTSRSYTTTQHHPSQPTARPRARNRRTTAANLDRKAVPKRRPPPLPPGTVKAKPPPQVSSPVKAPPVESDTVLVNARTEEAPLKNTPRQRPDPPPRTSLRPRVQRVKRPVSRMIPPPPNIPLPPPPVKKRPASESEDTSEKSPKESRRSSNTAKPTVLPKPAHLKRFSLPSLVAAPADKPNSNPKPTTPEIKKSPKLKPPPPTRSSSLASRPVPVKRKLQSVSDLQSIADGQEEVDSPLHVTDSVLNRKASKSAPPKRPPPPRPASVASNRLNEISPQSEAAPVITSSRGAVLYDANSQDPAEKEESGHSLRAKGTSLMRSLKKMVSRDSRKSSESGKERSQSSSREKVPPPLPAPRITDSHKQPQTDRTESIAEQNTTPLPKPRVSVIKTEQVEDIKTSSEESPPTTKPSRPPPPKTPPTQNKRNSVPSRPPPPKTSTANSETKDSVTHTQTEPSQEPSDTNKDSGEVATRPIPAPRANTPVKSDEAESHVIEDKPHDTENKSHDIARDSSPDTNFYHATEDYKAQSDKELSFSVGDVLIIVEKRGDGFHFGMLDDGTTGLFPLSKVEPFFH